MKGMPSFQYRSPAALEAWLSRLGERAAIDLGRRAESERARRVTAFVDGVVLHGNPAGEDRYVEQRLAIESDRMVAEATLSPKEREFLRLHHDEGQPFWEIALKLGFKSPQVAATTWTRICAKLRRAWP